MSIFTKSKQKFRRNKLKRLGIIPKEIKPSAIILYDALLISVNEFPILDILIPSS